jgi:hypothetical protein
MTISHGRKPVETRRPRAQEPARAIEAFGIAHARSGLHKCLHRLGLADSIALKGSREDGAIFFHGLAPVANGQSPLGLSRSRLRKFRSWYKIAGVLRPLFTFQVSTW